MSTTSLKLPDDLKEQAANAAAFMGVSPHAFMVDAIRQATRNAELRKEFFGEAEAALEHALSTGEVFDAREVHQHLRDRVEGKRTSMPKPKKL